MNDRDLYMQRRKLEEAKFRTLAAAHAALCDLKVPSIYGPSGDEGPS